ncbi:MAG TPA: hypothetical protein VGX68_17205 [Thermoanaerobaculia bacterium]|jgi:hypothetical protein|nr:hypothetical protein [Thermoanaerobaculia bacterium]
MKNAAPWLVVLLAISAVYPVSRVVKPAEEKKAAEKETAPPAATATATDEDCQGKGAIPAWCEPVRLIREFFALETSPEIQRDTGLSEVVARAKLTRYELRPLVALVPIPGDPRFDQALDAIQRGFAQAGYLVDRAWLPWTLGEAKGEGGAQKAPGTLLFRRWSDGSHQLAVVLLVGETPRAGIQKQAFLAALDLASALQGAGGEGTVGLLGPSFSGSAESIRLAVAAWKKQTSDTSMQFRMATGSATASGLEAIFREVDSGFCRTVLPDSDLHDAALSFLHAHLGWDLQRIALLTEADTSYGWSFVKQEQDERKQNELMTQELTAQERKTEELQQREPAGQELRVQKRRLRKLKEMFQARGIDEVPDHLVLVPFPSHISDLRNAFKEKEAKPASDVSALESQIQAGRQVLDLDVADRERTVDLIPISNPLTTRAGELMLANLLEAMSREGIRYAGILATNVKDKLFLAEEIRRFLPDTVLFTFDNDLLYAHSQYAASMEGALVLTTAPLFTEGAPGIPSSVDLEGRERRQFVSGFEQGTYQAVKYLLETGPVSPPEAWIAAVANGSLWPIARLPVYSPSARICGPPPTGPPPLVAAEGTGFTGKNDLLFLLAALVLCALAIWLEREALLRPVAGAQVDPAKGNRVLLTLGSLLLTAAAGTLLVIASVPLWARDFAVHLQRAIWEPAQIMYLGALGLAFAFLVFQTLKHARRTVRGGEWIAWVLGGGLLLVLLACGIRRLCIPGDQVELFHLRARALSSGLSPLPSLAALGAAIYAWLLNELVRRRLMARLAIDCPLPALCEPSSAGCAKVLERLGRLLNRTLPRDGRSWLLAALAFVPPAVLLWGTIQPIAETKGYGWFFVAFLLTALALAALSFYRFVRLWLGMRWLLERLDNASLELAAAFVAVGKEVEWRPIKSFGWGMPPFKILTLSVRKLRKLVEAGTLALPGYPEVLDVPLTGMFDGETGEGAIPEIEHRNEIEHIFAQACRDLSSRLAMPGVREFLALRVTAYLRYGFAHLRSCLIGTMVPGLLILLAVTFYAFQPKRFVSTGVWFALAVAVAVACWIFVQMDRNATLSRIGDTTPGQVTLDRAFWGNFLTYAGIPLLGLVAAQIPGLGRILGQLTDQLLRVTGGG